jgi:uncharacterized protein YciI
MWYLILRRAIKPQQEWTITLDEHLAWMREQHESGRILFSGPSADRKLGIYVVRAASRVEAEHVADADPFTKAGFCGFDLVEWDVRQIMGVGPFSSAGIERLLEERAKS